jgi:hypothetical protein
VPTHDATFSVNAKLFNVAQQAAVRADAGKNDVLVAVVFSVIWLESFVNEAVESIQWFLNNGKPPLPPRLRLLATVFAQTPDKLELPKKIQLMSLLLTGERLPTGNQPFQDFLLLVRLRNAFVHMKSGKLMKAQTGPGFVLIDGPKLTNGLRQRGLLISRKGDSIEMGWIEAVFNPSVAPWAFQTSREMAMLVAAMFPRKGRFRNYIEARIIGSPADIRASKRAKKVL